eukprot:GEMP01005841.1.p1 GENE.GEMP01005841.1~~GEMP01005841.1.p1  ORF type:complete len:677 (+),score=137.62 GEMP01005841.1:137-2167(+)
MESPKSGLTCGVRGCDASEEVLRQSAHNGRGVWGFPDPNQIHLPVDKRQRICQRCAGKSAKVVRMHWQRKPTLSSGIKTAQHDANEHNIRYWGIAPGTPGLAWILEELRQCELPPGWIQHVTHEGLFYFNKDSRVTTRDFPGKRTVELVVPILSSAKHTPVAELMEQMRAVDDLLKQEKLLWQGPFVGVGNRNCYYNVETGETRLDDVREQISFEQKIVSICIQRCNTTEGGEARGLQEMHSATRVQMQWRARQARLAAERLRAERIIANKSLHLFLLPRAGNDMLTSIVRIQRNYRGKQARRKYQLKKAQNMAIKYDQKHRLSQLSNTSIAAVMIQQAWRAYALTKAGFRSEAVMVAYRRWEKLQNVFSKTAEPGRVSTQISGLVLPETQWSRKSMADLNAMRESRIMKARSVRSIVEVFRLRKLMSIAVDEEPPEAKQPEKRNAARSRNKSTAYGRTTVFDNGRAVKSSAISASVVSDEDGNGLVDSRDIEDRHDHETDPDNVFNAPKMTSNSESEESSECPSSSVSSSSFHVPDGAASPTICAAPSVHYADIGDTEGEPKLRRLSTLLLGGRSFSGWDSSESSDDYCIPPYTSITQFEHNAGSSFSSNLPASARVIMPIGEKYSPVAPLDRTKLIEEKLGRTGHSPNARKRQAYYRPLSPLPVELKFHKRYYA